MFKHLVISWIIGVLGTAPVWASTQAGAELIAVGLIVIFLAHILAPLLISFGFSKLFGKPRFYLLPLIVTVVLHGFFIVVFPKDYLFSFSSFFISLAIPTVVYWGCVAIKK